MTRCDNPRIGMRVPLTERQGLLIRNS